MITSDPDGRASSCRPFGLRGKALQQEVGRNKQQQGHSDHQSDEPDGRRNPALSSMTARTPDVVDVDRRQPGFGIWGRHEEEAHQPQQPGYEYPRQQCTAIVSERPN